MIRWASCGLVVLLGGAVVGVRAEHCALPLDRPLPPAAVLPNPFGGAPIAFQPKPPPPGPPGVGPDQPPGPAPGGPRPIRPVFTLPGPPKLDRHGDPLPAGAVVRYGTVRLRHGADVQAMGFTHDGKLLCTVSSTDDSVKLWDPATGKEVARLHTPVQLAGLCKDGSVVIVDDVRVRVWLPATSTTRDLPEKTLPEGAAPTALAVNPDGRSFAVAANGRVVLLDLQTGKTLKELNLPGPPPAAGPLALGLPAPPGANPPNPNVPPSPPPVKLLYSPDGRWLVGNGQKTGVWLWDLRTGKRVRTYRTEADFPEYTFSPDVTRLAVTGERLHLYPLDSEEAVEGFKGPEGRLVFAPRFAPDGKTLFAVEQDGTVLPVDAATGEEKEGLDAPEMNLRPPFALAPGGARVAAVDQSGGIRIWDPKTGKGPEVTRLPPLSDPGFAPGGKSVTVIDQTNKVHTFDAASGAPGKVLELPGEESGFPSTWDPASRRAATVVPGGDELEIQVVDADTGKVVSKHQVPQNGGVPVVSFASANRDRMALFTQVGVAVVNPTTGKTVRSFHPGPTENGGRGALSPDGRLVAVPTRPLTVWEVATGKKRLTVDGAPNADVVTFSADSRFLAAWDQGGSVVVVDVRTGTAARRLQAPDATEGVTALALSADGKRVAAGAPTGRVTVWDVAGGDVLAPFAGHDGAVTGLAFAPDGKRLVSSGGDGTALVWEVPDKPQPAGPVESAVTGFDEAFRLLGSADAAQAQRGLDYLYRRPDDAVTQAAERMPAPAPVPAEKLARHVADLESDDFQTREAAVKALGAAGGEAGAVLREVAQKSTSAEARKLAGELLGKIDAPATKTDDLRVLRAVEAMENLGTPAARGQLEKWAAGPAGHRLTLEAVAALARLKAGGK
jgi:WD40 repeat protein